ncbi:MAG: 2,4-dihydroxyhept-2-ene,7-dioic acid aldolase [Firmicutes bacterium]|nr:2,4-dihydroxyhept-2-ene,7-dioic acid aldolase [Bacillota bacterium]
MHENRLRKMLNENRPTVGTRLSSTWPTVTEAVAATGHYDYIEFLAEYAPYSQYDLENICRAAELHGMATMIKVDYQNRGFVAQKAVASGFQAILFTDHRTADEVRETLRLIHPDCPGHDGLMGFANRRWIGFRPASTQLEFAAMAKKTVAAFMIEKKAAMDNIEEICSVPGVDIVQFGPYDYAMSCGINQDENIAEIKATERRMIEIALKHDVRPRCEIQNPNEAQYYIDLGVRDFNLGSELRIMQNYWRSEGQKLQDMIQG